MRLWGKKTTYMYSDEREIEIRSELACACERDREIGARKGGRERERAGGIMMVMMMMMMMMIM